MWICLNNSFLSVVENQNDKSQLLVRARRKGDIEKVFIDANVFENTNVDYRYRTYIQRDRVADIMYNSIMNINYDNFKNSVRDDDLHDAYSDFWLTMNKLQNNF
jgi:hypothetical protein